MNDKIDELCLKVIESYNRKVIDELLVILGGIPKPISENIMGSLSMIIENWQENPGEQPDKSDFLLELASFFKNDFPLLRTVLPSIIKKKLKPEINKLTAIQSLGIRDKTISLAEVYKRYKNIQVLEKDKYYYNNISKSWGIIGDIDWITGSVSLLNFDKIKIHEVDLSSILEHTFIFKSTKQIMELEKLKTPPDRNKACKVISDNAVQSINEHNTKNILLEMFVPRFFTLDTFKQWWEQDPRQKTAAIENLTLENARSIQELHNSINTPEFEKIGLTKQDKIKISEILKLIKPTSSSKEFFMWAEIVSKVFPAFKSSEVELLIPENENVFDIIWPEKIHTDSKICIEIWTKLKAIFLPQWIKFTKEANGEEYLIDILVSLPWKVWTSFTAELKLNFLNKKFSEISRITHPEILLWIWKNKSKASEDNLNKLRYSNIVPAISKERSGAIWQAAQKELKKLLLEDTEFQSTMLGDKTEEDVLGLIEHINNSTTFTPSEKQSLIVKISRLSNHIRKILESEKAKKLIPGTKTEKVKKLEDDIHITSTRSYNKAIQELQNIINKEMPENTKAIATARAHGDLRENAEFAAAKERQKFLNKQRAMLERKIASTQHSDFSEINIKDTVIAGSSVTLLYENNQTETFHILGIWDGDPGKQYISYDTEFGQALVGKKLNTQVILPNNQKCVIAKITPLSDEIKKELSL